jgi:hypothetical protein
MNAFLVTGILIWIVFIGSAVWVRLTESKTFKRGPHA